MATFFKLATPLKIIQLILDFKNKVNKVNFRLLKEKNIKKRQSMSYRKKTWMNIFIIWGWERPF